MNVNETSFYTHIFGVNSNFFKFLIPLLRKQKYYKVHKNVRRKSENRYKWTMEKIFYKKLVVCIRDNKYRRSSREIWKGKEGNNTYTPWNLLCHNRTRSQKESSHSLLFTFFLAHVFKTCVDDITKTLHYKS